MGKKSMNHKELRIIKLQKKNKKHFFNWVPLKGYVASFRFGTKKKMGISVTNDS